MTADEKPTAEEIHDILVGEAQTGLTAALRNLYRLFDRDEEKVGQALHAAAAAAVDQADGPIVIKVESLGETEFVTLREYIEHYIQDWEIGLDDARWVLAEAPKPFIYNQDDAILHPEYLQLHTAIDQDLLGAEIERLAREEF